MHIYIMYRTILMWIRTVCVRPIRVCVCERMSTTSSQYIPSDERVSLDEAGGATGRQAGRSNGRGGWRWRWSVSAIINNPIWRAVISKEYHMRLENGRIYFMCVHAFEWLRVGGWVYVEKLTFYQSKFPSSLHSMFQPTLSSLSWLRPARRSRPFVRSSASPARNSNTITRRHKHTYSQWDALQKDMRECI